MLSRWYFHQTCRAEDQELLAFKAESMPCLGRVPLHKRPTHFFISTQEGRSIVIGMHPDAWKLGDSSWWRKDIVEVCPHILRGEKLKRSREHITYLVWSRELDLLEGRVNVRTLHASSAEMEASCLWGWIRYVIDQPVSVQKRGGLVQGFMRWLAKKPALTLPPPLKM